MNTAAIQENWEGQLVDGRFPLLQWLGGSKQSAVFRTELRGQPPRKAAIKLIAADADTVEALVSRWEMTVGLSHPHLIRLFQTGQCEINAIPLLYVVMEYAEENLSQVLPLRPLSAAETAEMLPPLVDALSCIHEKGWVHGHIKPSNIMAVENQLKLSTDSMRAAGESHAGALELNAYDAPEVATAAIRPPADVWSLGATLLTALTQHPPAWEKSGNLTLPDSITEPFRTIARESLRTDPARRCTLARVKALLQPPSVVETVEQPAARAHPMRRGVAPFLAGVVVVAVLAVVAGTRFFTPPPQTQPARTTATQEHSDGGITPPSSATHVSPPAAKVPGGVAARGAVAERVLPDVPQKARNTIRGHVRVGVRVSVDPGGKVSAASLDSPGPSKYFARLALEAARGWKFEPPTVDGHGVASEWLLRFQFGRTETKVVPVEVVP